MVLFLSQNTSSVVVARDGQSGNVARVSDYTNKAGSRGLLNRCVLLLTLALGTSRKSLLWVISYAHLFS